MIRVFSLAAIATLAFCQSDPRGWANARWGMTRQQLSERLSAKFVSPLTIYSPKRESHLGLDFELNALKFRAYFFVDEAFGLDVVRLKCLSESPTLANFSRLESDLTAKYGPPRKRDVKTTNGIDASAYWTVGSTSIALEMVDIMGKVGDKSVRARGLDITYKRIGTDKL